MNAAVAAGNNQFPIPDDGCDQNIFPEFERRFFKHDVRLCKIISCGKLDDFRFIVGNAVVFLDSVRSISGFTVMNEAYQFVDGNLRGRKRDVKINLMQKI